MASRGAGASSWWGGAAVGARGRAIRASRPSKCAPNRADSSYAQASYGSSRTKASRRRDGRPDPTLASFEGDEGKRVSGREREEEER